jgi:uncharacterized membrane protein
MDWVFLIILFLHVMGAIIAFGPTYAFIVLGPMTGREPAHANFALRFQEATSKRLIVPLAIFQGVTGVLLIWKVGINVFATTWLLVGIALYLIALATAFLVLIPTTAKLVEATSTPPPPPAPGAPPPSGPPPHIAALVRRARMAGMFNALLIVIIVFLMVTKPF